MEYVPRVVDAELASRLGRAGAVLVEGPKACGKTETARRVCASEIRIDVDATVRPAMAIDPGRLLLGATPRLIDEWQEQRDLWDYVRRAVDDRGQPGQFVLTGSSNPDDRTHRHSGAGRVSRLQMRPLSSWEAGFSTGEVSLAALLRGGEPSSGASAATLEDIAEQIARGGWPAGLNLSTPDALAANRDYVALLAEVDMSRVSDVRRDPRKVRQLLASIARNVATEASMTTLMTDTGGADQTLSRQTVIDYYSALERLMIVDDLPAWRPHIRSSAALRQAVKRHLADPSLAVAALGIGVPALLADLRYLGFLFEAAVVRDLRVYTQGLEATVEHYRDSSGLEVDAIVRTLDNRWAGFEVKLGLGDVDQAAAALLKLADRADTGQPPLALTVVTGFGFAHRRPDGVNVVPLTALKP